MAGRGPAMEVVGARQLRASLKAAGIGVADLKAAHKAVAEMVAQAAKVPHRSGRLAASVRPSGTQTAAIVRAGSARVPYANPIHWGWPSRHIKANPFLLDAAERKEQDWTRTYLQALEALINTIEGAPDA